MINVYENKKFRKALSEFLNKEFDDCDRSYDVRQTMKAIAKIERGINQKDKIIELKDMDLWEHAIEMINITFDCFGSEYVFSEKLTQKSVYEHQHVFVRRSESVYKDTLEELLTYAIDEQYKDIIRDTLK